MHRIIKAIRLGWPLGLAPLTFALLLTGACGTASAEVWTKLSVAAALPAEGASLIAFPTPYPEDVTFAIESSTTGLIGPKVNIATQNAVNSNGRMFPEVRVEALYLKESERDPEVYAGYSTYEPWATIPGTYYWQFEGERTGNVTKCEWNPYLGEEYCYPTSESFDYLSPVYTLVITPKSSPPPASPPPAATTPPPTPPSITAFASSGSVKLSSGTGTIAAGCGAASNETCTFALTLVATVHGAHASAVKHVTVGTVTGNVQGGKSGKLAVKLNSRGRGYLKHNSLHLEATGSVKSTAGLVTKISRHLTIKKK